MKKIIAITGKIGAGKSTLTKYLEKSFSVFSVDKIQKELYKKENKLWKMVERNYPEFIVNKEIDYNLIKEKLIDNKIFKNEYQKKVIEIIIPVLKEMYKDSVGLTFIEIPYINSNKLMQIFDAIVVVKANDNIRLQRIIKRDNVDEIFAQKWANAYVENINLEKSIIITNNSSLYNLEKQLTEVFKCLIL